MHAFRADHTIARKYGRNGLQGRAGTGSGRPNIAYPRPGWWTSAGRRTPVKGGMLAKPLPAAVGLANPCPSG